MTRLAELIQKGALWNDGGDFRREDVAEMVAGHIIAELAPTDDEIRALVRSVAQATVELAAEKMAENPNRGADGERLTKTEQIRLVGNSVSPPIAEALVRANAPDLVARDEAREARVA